MRIYVAESSCGYGDEHHHLLLYAGTNRDEAIAAAENAPFQSEYNQWSWITEWEGGKQVGYEMVIE